MLILITGPSGAGSTTLGLALAERLDLTAIDTDAHYWQPTDPPFQTPRPVAERLAGMQQILATARDAVIMGSVDGWAGPVTNDACLIILLGLSKEAQHARLLARERQRYGARIDAGGDMASTHAAFMAWALAYHDPDATGRNRARHLAWADAHKAPLLALDATLPTLRQVAMVRSELVRLGLMVERSACRDT